MFESEKTRHGKNISQAMGQTAHCTKLFFIVLFQLFISNIGMWAAREPRSMQSEKPPLKHIKTFQMQVEYKICEKARKILKMNRLFRLFRYINSNFYVTYFKFIETYIVNNKINPQFQV